MSGTGISTVIALKYVPEYVNIAAVLVLIRNSVPVYNYRIFLLYPVFLFVCSLDDALPADDNI